MTRYAAPSPPALECAAIPERLIDVRELSAWLQVPESWVYDRTRRAGAIPHRKIGKYIRFAPSEIEAWLESHRTGASNHA